MCREIFYLRRCGCETDLVSPGQSTMYCDKQQFTRCCSEYVAKTSYLNADDSICRACITWSHLPGRAPEHLLVEERKFYEALEVRLPEIERETADRNEAFSISSQRKMERELRDANLEKVMEESKNKLTKTIVGSAFYSREDQDEFARSQRAKGVWPQETIRKRFSQLDLQ